MDQLMGVFKGKGLLKALIKAIMWAFTYYFVRRGFNPEVTDPSKYKTDTFYGALATFIGTILTPIVTKMWLGGD